MEPNSINQCHTQGSAVVMAIVAVVFFREGSRSHLIPPRPVKVFHVMRFPYVDSRSEGTVFFFIVRKFY